MMVGLRPYAAPRLAPFRWQLPDVWLELRIWVVQRLSARANTDYDATPTDYARLVVKERYNQLQALRSRRRAEVAARLAGGPRG